MSGFKLLVILGCLLVVIAICFFIYAISNPQASFPWNNTVTYMIYIVYGLITVLVWGLAIKSNYKKK